MKLRDTNQEQAETCWARISSPEIRCIPLQPGVNNQSCIAAGDSWLVRVNQETLCEHSSAELCCVRHCASDLLQHVYKWSSKQSFPQADDADLACYRTWDWTHLFRELSFAANWEMRKSCICLQFKEKIIRFPPQTQLIFYIIHC